MAADEVAQVSLTGVMRAGAACTGFRGLSPSGAFTRIELEPGGDTVELPPLSILRIPPTSRRR